MCHRILAALAACCFWQAVAPAAILAEPSLPAPSDDAAYGASATVPAPPRPLQSIVRTYQEVPSQALAANVGELLERTPNLLVQRTDGASATPILRGLTGYRVLLLADDLRLNDALTRVGGNALLNLLDVEAIDHIEVIRGPASVEYGSDALGGVVKAVSRQVQLANLGQPHPNEARLTGSLTTAGNSRHMLGAFATANARLGLRTTFGWGESGPLLRGGHGGIQQHTGYAQYSVASRMDMRLAPHARLSVMGQRGHLGNAPRPELSTSGRLELTRRLERDALWLRYEGQPVPGRLLLSAYGGLAERREWRQQVRPGQTRNEHDGTTAYQAGLRLRWLRPWAGAEVRGGLSVVVEDTFSRATQQTDTVAAKAVRGRYVDNSDYDQYALYALFTQEFNDCWQVQTGARLSTTQIFAPADPVLPRSAEQPLEHRLLGLTATAGLRYVQQHWSWVASLLSGFRAPNLEDFQALGSGARGLGLPNPALSEERSYTLETGVEHDGEVGLHARLFHTWLDALIVPVPATYMGSTEFEGRPVTTRQNASQGVLYGGELGASWDPVPGLQVGAAAWVTWGSTQLSAAPDSRRPASKVPPLSGHAYLRFVGDDGRYAVGAELLGVATKRHLSDDDRDDLRICPQGTEACHRISGYAIANIHVSAALQPHLQLSVDVENLLDRDYKPFASGVYGPGRNLRVSLSGSL